MATITRFEEIEAWQRARELTRSVYRVSTSGPLARDFGLRDQMRRAAVSIMANIAEGFERGGDREFLQFLAVAKASAAELRSHFYVAADIQFLSQNDFDKLSGLCVEAARLIAGLMKYLQGSYLDGSKYKGV